MYTKVWDHRYKKLLYAYVWDSKCLQSTCRVLKKGSTKEVHACAKYHYNRWAVGYAVCLPILASNPCKMHRHAMDSTRQTRQK